MQKLKKNKNFVLSEYSKHAGKTKERKKSLFLRFEKTLPEIYLSKNGSITKNKIKIIARFSINKSLSLLP